MTKKVAGDTLDAPFPLSRKFVTWVLPLLLVLLVVSGYGSIKISTSVMEGIYLHLAQKKADGIAHGVSSSVPEQWQTLLSGQELTEEALGAIGLAFEQEREEFHLPRLKVYDLSRRTLYATERASIGEIEQAPALTAVLASGVGDLLKNTEKTGEVFYEFYLPYVIDGKVRAVFELYEPVGFLDGLLWDTAQPLGIATLLVFLVLMLVLSMLVRRAQDAINQRTNAIVQLRQRIESLVSRMSVAAMKNSDSDGQPQNLTCTILFSDIRDFTGFCEQKTPREVIDFLNAMMNLQVQIIEKFGGDVDKIIGDAVFARFHGEGAAETACKAAMAIQQAVRGESFPRPIGIGVYSGLVIAGQMGAKTRFDYTVIGDTVNIAARLCSAAEAFEVVVDVETLAKTGVADQFQPEEKLSLKGKQLPLAVKRWKA